MKPEQPESQNTDAKPKAKKPWVTPKIYEENFRKTSQIPPPMLPMTPGQQNAS